MVDETWEVSGHGHPLVVTTASGRPVATMLQEGDQGAADARLVSAAPHLRDALHRLVAAIEAGEATVATVAVQEARHLLRSLSR